MSVVAAHPALAIWGSIIVAVCLTAYALLRLTRETGQHAQARQFEADLDDWQWHAAPQVHHEEYLTAPVPERPGTIVWEHPCDCPRCRDNPDGPVMLPPDAPDGAHDQTPPLEDPPAGDEDPGPGGLPEGDTQLLWPPQETAGPGDPLTPLEKARAAMDEVKATPLSDYLDEVGEATAYGDDAPFTNWLSQDTITRGMKAVS